VTLSTPKHAEAAGGIWSIGHEPGDFVFRVNNAFSLTVSGYRNTLSKSVTSRNAIWPGLKLLSHINNPATNNPKLLAVGETVPDFTLTDQVHNEVSLS